MQLDDRGRPAGKGGNIALETYSRRVLDLRSRTISAHGRSLSSTIRLPGSDGTPEGNALALNRTISAYGLAQGGTLSLQAPGIVIDGEEREPRGVLRLSSDFFDGNAFGAYKLTSVAGDLTIAPGTTITLRQQNFVAEDALLTLQTGAKLAEATGVGLLRKSFAHLSI